MIDDDSADATAQIATDMKKNYPQVEVMVRRGRAPGLGDSIKDGYAYALDRQYQQVCIIDCDLQQDPAEIRLLQNSGGGCELVVGTRYASRESFHERYNVLDRYLSVVANFALRFMFGLELSDITTDYYLIHRSVLEAIDPASMVCCGFALFSEVKIRAARAGFCITELPTTTALRLEGESKRSFRQIRAFARESLAVWRDVHFGPWITKRRRK